MSGIVLGILFGIVAECFWYFYYLREEFPRAFISPVFGILIYMFALAATLWKFVKDVDICNQKGKLIGYISAE